VVKGGHGESPPPGGWCMWHPHCSELKGVPALMVHARSEMLSPCIT
jgi:hypothetical protein